MTTNIAARAVDAVKVYGSGDTQVRALDGVDVELEAGRFTAIMGPSGSGKSTLMHCLAGLDQLTSGQVLIGDTDLSSLSEKQLTELRRDRIGFVFQAFNLLPTLTVEENVRLPLELTGKRGAEADSRVRELLGMEPLPEPPAGSPPVDHLARREDASVS